MSNYSKQELYRAHLTRDYRFDGKFFVAVKTTKIYCRPVCPARKAKLENLTFYEHAVQAQEAGYRPCIRCRPETAPDSPAWLGKSATVRRAVRVMESTALDELSVFKMAKQLGIGERWFRSLFQQELGTTPQTYLLNKKLDLAKTLLDSTSQPITAIALNAGFNSVRRFNDAFKKKFGATPSSFKKLTGKSATQTIYLRYRPPLAWVSLINFFAQRSILSMEQVTDNCYERLFIHSGIPGWFKASLVDDNKLRVDFKLAKPAPILNFVARIRQLFDLDADPLLIEQDLNQDKKLKPLLEQKQGLRVPGCFDSFELAVRAIIGQKISVKGARAALIRLVERCGRKQTFDNTLALTRFFPTPQAILEADLSSVGITGAKIQTLKSLAQAVEEGVFSLDGTDDYDTVCQHLLAIKGIGPWTVQYIAMRGLRNPDAFPETDLEIRKQVTKHRLNPDRLKPWRAYGAILLFNQ